ncbi:type I secretion system permease/ATPase [Vibrio sp. V09_P4A23P171]|uniref:type I secretion system permease/ATPase n=1 Tax=Vibrio TaxID=662 RepID=UPI0009804A79|nr:MULTISPECIES: type I secretion system permease/ATPase [Vibrio]NAW90465.1 type I secretion system permease/ATPase [Vibrio sp. V24_P1S3T111]AQP35963.1 peptidase C39 [Vibrio anguillarum]OXX21456.1 type I secretion system permease/ATPase [Vibrio sp. V06_P1A73T115]OXX23681.1 type I secretion system permease/ATPase [Vibrio sp. V05_P4A8T149]OXX29214.1 type I secretion system permease/ATPase [Vibrio sp. V14_P6S14T42]
MDTLTNTVSTVHDQESHGALAALSFASLSFDKKVTPSQLIHTLGVAENELSALDIQRAAQSIGLKSRMITVRGSEPIPLPALVKIRQQWHVIHALNEYGWTLYDPIKQRYFEFPLAQGSSSSCYEVLLLIEQSIEPSDVAFGLRWFMPSVLRQSKQLRDVFLYSIVLQLFALFGPKLFETVIDKVLVGRSLSSLHVLALAMLALAIAEPLYSYLRNTVFGHLSSQVNAELSGRLYRHLINLPLSYFKQRQTGQIIARVREMGQIRQFLTGSTLMLLLDLIFITLFIGVMFHYAPALTGLIIGSLVIYFLLWLGIGPWVRHKVTTEYDAEAETTTFLTESITGIETIKTTATEARFLERWQQILSRQIECAFSAQKASLIAGQLIALVQKIAAAILLWWGVNLVLNGQLTPGELVAFNMLAGHVTQPVLRLAQVWQDFQHTLVALRRVGDILNEPAENSKDGLASIPSVQGGIEFKNVRFRYHIDAPEVLANLSLTIAPGQFIGITGPSGSGKSTLTKLLQRLYVPLHGQVLVDGMDLAIADPVSLRRSMSVVLQESMLFAGSVADNIRLCKPDASDAELINVAKLAGALSFIEALPQGFEQQVGERGANLSGGQRQRIALARALLVNPKILLLDEATSALDYQSEAAIMSNMETICHDRTVISIAHRLSTIRHADNIIVIEDGQVAEQGTHEALLARAGLYARLWKQQVSG